jgi:phosphocarrier protein FPr/phosphocarrier protein
VKPLVRAAAELLDVAAPLAAWAAPLDEAPDEVFAGRMLGDGVALDPLEGVLRAPCDGVVASLPRTRHAVTLRADNGAELLMHVGLDTVALGGEGFEAHVAEGQRVRRGDPLLTFDLDQLAARAKSLLTPVVVINAEAFEIVGRVTGRQVRQGETLMQLRALAGAPEALSAAASEAAVERAVTLALPHGLHARPAARLAALSESYRAEVEIAAGARSAALRSPVSLMTLGAAKGETLRIIARGPDARAAVDAVEALLTRIGAEEQAEPARAAPQPQPDPPGGGEGVLRGVTAAPGFAIGVAVRLSAPEPLLVDESRGAAEERRVLAEALGAVAQRLAREGAGGGAQRREILAAHGAFLADPELRAAAERAIDEGQSAGRAWRSTVRVTADALRSTGDPRFTERADDLLDLERQVLFAISGEETRAPPLPQGAVVIAEELLPSQVIALEGAPVAGFCTARGGATSHVAILAAAMGVPAVAAIGPELMRVPDGAAVVLDADAGTLRVAPDRAAIEAAQGELARRAARRRRELEGAMAPCRLADGTRIDVFANLGALAEAAPAVALGAEGCGLFRTEFLYLDRREPPSEDEQTAAYQALAEALAGRPLTIRTLDAGGDKPLAFAPGPAEVNPALGLRGVRASLRHPELLRAQLRAILRVSAAGERRILLPMVSDLSDLRAVKAILAEVATGGAAQLGVMIETPAAALLADQLAAEADFLSIGTNDLTQYVLAMDREHADLASRLDGLHPALLRLIARVGEAAAAAGRPVSVCGGLASDVEAAPLLVGLGVRALSAAPAAVPALKARLCPLDLAACRAVAVEALALASADEVRALVRRRLPHDAHGVSQ